MIKKAVQKWAAFLFAAERTIGGKFFQGKLN